MTGKRTATERLAATRAALKAEERHIGELEELRRELLLADDDDGAVAISRDLSDARLLVQCLAEKIALLEPLAGRELFTDRQALSNPESLQRVRHGYEHRLRWHRIQPHPDQAEIDRLVAVCAFLKAA